VVTHQTWYLWSSAIISSVYINIHGTSVKPVKPPAKSSISRKLGNEMFSHFINNNVTVACACKENIKGKIQVSIKLF